MGRRLSGGQFSTLNSVVSTSATLCPKCGNSINDLTEHTQAVSSSWTLTQLMNDKDKQFICLDT